MANSPLQFLLFDDEPAADEPLAAVLGDDDAPPTATADPAGLTPPAPFPLEDLHPALWRAHQLGQQRQGATSSGCAELDLQLPGHGWPHRALTELLLPHAGIGELRLLAPALATLQQAERPVLLFDPPALPCAEVCLALGLSLQQLVLVKSRPQRPGAGASHARLQQRLQQRLPVAADLLWTLEQTLASGHAGAVLAWLPPVLGMEALRRLQFAAQAHDGPAFLLRPLASKLKPSVAPLRIELTPAPPDALTLRLLKRRGPPLAEALHIELPPVLTASARERSRRAGSAAAASAAQHA